MDEGETWTSYARRKRENRDFTGGEALSEVVRLDQTKIHSIGQRIGSGARTRLGPGIPELLAKIDLPLQALGSECRYVKTVVVENGVRQLEFVVVEQLWNGVTDQPTLLQAAYVRLEGQSLVAPAEVQPGHIEFHSRAHASRTLGRGRSGRLSSLELQSKSVREGVARSLL